MKKGMLKGQRRELLFTVIFESEHDCVYLVSAQGVSYDISAGICGYETETNFTVWGYGKRV